MPGTVRTISRLYLVILALVLLAIGLTVAVYAVVASNRVAGCVNDAQRNGRVATNLEQDARYQSTLAELRYLQGRASKQSVIEKKAAYVTAQQKATAYRAAHPAGRC